MIHRTLQKSNFSTSVLPKVSLHIQAFKIFISFTEQVLKFGSNRERNHYYPIPSKIGDYSERVPQNKISNRTADALRDLRLSHFTTTYQRVHGNGEVASRHNTDRFNSLKTIAGMNSEVSLFQIP